MKRLIILSVVIASILYSKEDKVIVSINGLESAGLSKRYINYAQYTIQELSIDLEETVSKMIGDKYSINIHFTAYESVENTINVARDSLSMIIKTIKDKYPDEDLVTHSISHPYNGIQGVIIGKVQIQVNIDNSINLDKSIDISNKSSEIFNWIFMDLQDCRECISFNNMDMDSINGKNTILLTRDDIYDDSWAVIIGIDNYQNATNLDYAVEDAEAVKELLIGKFDYPEDNVKMLMNQEANKVNIIKVISDISISAGENDRVLVFFAGHGETMDLPDGGEMGFLFPVDGNQDNLYASAIPMNDLKDWSNISNAKHMLFLVDACYGGLASVGSRSLDVKTTPNYIEKITKNKSRQIITAGGRDEKVIERPEWGHSAFTLNLMRGLGDGNADMNADGYITANELGIFLSESVTIDSENQQTPQSRKLTSQEGEFVFVYSENTDVIKDKSTDAKDELETKKLIGLDKDETLLDRARWSNWSKKYPKNMTNPDIYGIYVLIMEDTQGIMFSTKLSPGWAALINFVSIKSSLLNESSQELQSYNGNSISFFLAHSLIQLEAPVWIGGFFGMNYTNFSWPNESNKINKILPVAGIHLGLQPLPSILPPLLLGINITVTPYPKSYNEIDGVIQFDDWDIQFSPAVEIGLAIPKYIFFPE